MKSRTARRDEWSRHAFRVLLGLYPGEFRDEYGRELALVFADRYRDAATVRQRAAIWVEAIAGLLREAPKEHARLIVHDVRGAARAVLHSPGFAATVVLTLALGIGANTAIFQLISAVHLRALPVPNPADLAEVRIAGGTPGFGVTPGRYGELTRPVWDEIRAHQQAFSGVFGWTTRNLGIGEMSNLRPANGIAVSGLVRERVLAVLAAFFGGLATLLAIVGVYGLISFLVAARRTEIGVRLALGARRGQVVAMMMRQVAWLLALGVPLGAGVALLASRSARALLFRLEPHDPTTIALACLALIVIAVAASLIPARRAASLDPLASLRSE